MVRSLTSTPFPGGELALTCRADSVAVDVVNNKVNPPRGGSPRALGFTPEMLMD
jgi:hypothetical protein